MVGLAMGLGGDPAALQKMSNGAHAGLQTAAAMSAQISSHRRAEEMLDRGSSSKGRRGKAGGGGDGGGEEETIYRDASGRVVNIAMKRAEARAQAEEAERRKREEEDKKRGDVQIHQREERKRELAEAAETPFARGADDEKLNAELKERNVWGDPMAGQLETEPVTAAKGKGVKVISKSITGRPLYKGAAAPNRYGIRPGHKWDGVDRGSGFEGEWFKARNVQKGRQDLEWNWMMDD